MEVVPDDGTDEQRTQFSRLMLDACTMIARHVATVKERFLTV